MSPVGARGAGPRLLSDPSWWALAALYLFTAVAVAGFGTFALRPHLLPDSDMARSVFRGSFPLFAQAHIWLAGLVLAAALARRGGLAWLPAAAAIYGVSFLSEYVGTGYGLPFGSYEYTALLGPKLGGRVPYPIPLSWFLMALPSYAIARWAYPGPGLRLDRLGLATALLVSWDLALDPAMSRLTPYWVWGQEGLYYGMPAVNLLGWTATGLVLMGILEASGARERVASVPVSWMAAYWGALLLMPLGMLVVAGAWLAVGVTLAVVAPLLGLARRRGMQTLHLGGESGARTPARHVVAGGAS